MYDVAVEQRNDPEWTYFDSKSIEETLPYSKLEIESSLTYLKGEHLVETAYETLNSGPSYKIAHLGVREIERSMQKPEEPTEHFPAPVNMYFNAPVGAVQMGSGATADVTQNIGADFSDVLSLMEQLKLHVTELPQEQQEDASVSIEMLEDELKSQSKSPKRIRAAFVGLKGIARGTVTFAAQVATLAQQLKNLGVF